MFLSWCGWHIQVYAFFMKMLTWAWYEAFGHHGGTKRVPRRRNKNGATATYSKMMPRQHIGSGSSWRYRCKRKRADVWNMLEMVGCSRLPGSHGIVAWKRVTIRTRCKHMVHLIHARASHRGRLGLYLWSVRFWSGSSSERCRGSRRSRDVVVHGS